LIVDEALGVGDEMFQRRSYRRIEQIKRDGRTIMFVSHDTNAIKSICDEALLLDKGEIIERGSPDRVAKLYQRMIASREAEYLRWVRSRHSGATLGMLDEPDITSSTEGEHDDSKMFRYGDQSNAEIIDYELLDENDVPNSSFETGELCKIRLVVAFHANVDEPQVGILIRNVIGLEVYGTNNAWMGIRLPPQRPGDVLVVEYEQELWLGVGSYFVQIGVTDAMATVPFDRHVDAIFFRVQNQERMAGIANLRSKFTFSNLDRDLQPTAGPAITEMDGPA
jgi:hypothetical protein